MSNWSHNYTTFIGTKDIIDTIFSVIYEGNGDVNLGRIISESEAPSWKGYSVTIEYKTNTMLLISFDMSWNDLTAFFNTLRDTFDDLTVLNLTHREDKNGITEHIGTKTANLCYWQISSSSALDVDMPVDYNDDLVNIYPQLDEDCTPDTSQLELMNDQEFFINEDGFAEAMPE